MTRVETALAYPLVLVTGSGMDARGWATTAEAWLVEGTGVDERGIVVLTARAGTIVALFFYRFGAPPPCCLRVSMLHVLEPTGTPKVLAATLRAAGELAARRACTELRVELDRTGPAALELEDGLDRLSTQLDLCRTGRCWSRRLESAEVVSLAERQAQRRMVQGRVPAEERAG